AAAFEAPPPGILENIEAILGLDGADVLRYADKKKNQHRSVRLVRNGEQAELAGFVLAGDVSAQTWIKALLQDELPAQAYGRLLLLPGAKSPGAMVARGKPVCSCFSVSDEQITAGLREIMEQPGGAGRLASDEDRFLALQDKLKCGTNCGSCVPEIKRLIRTSAPGPTAPDASGRRVIPIKALA
ncbi:MAG: (2Fe-2S)-binding protein, partial [Polaromonas sp.]|nr:(2Fe-2S)-binding protein [Polaromonas sp.]